MQYQFTEIEKRWRAYWEEHKSYAVSNHSNKPKCYVLDMFPYPSGSGLHVGHPLGYIASDIYSRFKRLQGYNVLHPMGFDAFGLPAEQYAIETGQHPVHTTQTNIARYKEQLGLIGFCYDWSREVITSDPSYYQWTQWIFLQLYNSWYNPESQKAEPIATLKTLLADPTSSYYTLFTNPEEEEKHIVNFRLAYHAESYVNWCEALGTVLANDEVVNGVSERGGHPVERKKMSQWFLRITAYANRLLEGLDRVDYPESLKEMQRNWIGRSEGAELQFEIDKHTVTVFTTRPDTLFGASFLVLAPEHEAVAKITTADQQSAVSEYQRYTASRSERDRLAETKQVTGCFTGAYAKHPITGIALPVWIADYVLAGYGTGAIMAVPAGDDRDYLFAKHFQLPIPSIFEETDISEKACTSKDARLMNSDFLNGLPAKEAITAMLTFLEDKQLGKRKINFRMRDAGFSRQRYWGEPFPISYTEQGMPVTVDELPLTLPHLETYGPGPNGKGPLANATDWVSYEKEGEKFMRETDTMPGFAGSSWYYLRYMDPGNTQEFCNRQVSDYWNQVDVYVGGAEHAVGHLLYSRMWCKALYDLGHIGFDEPYKKLLNQGMIQGNSRLVYRVKGQNTFVSYGLRSQYETDTLYTEYAFCDGLELDIEKFKQWKSEYQDAEFILEDGKYICGSLVEKMSKRLFNVVNPDTIIEQYGADTFRMYEMFLGPIEMSKPWDTKGIEGVHRFLKKLWRLFYDEVDGLKVTQEVAQPEELKVLHKHIKKIQHDIEHFALNTAVSQFMIVTNELTQLGCSKKEILEPLTITLAPFAPHLAEELFQALGNTTSVLDATYPAVNESYLVESTFVYPVAVQGKARAEMELDLSLSEEEIKQQVLSNEIILKWMDGKPLKKLIYVKGRMINVVV